MADPIAQALAESTVTQLNLAIYHKTLSPALVSPAKVPSHTEGSSLSLCLLPLKVIRFEVWREVVMPSLPANAPRLIFSTLPKLLPIVSPFKAIYAKCGRSTTQPSPPPPTPPSSHSLHTPPAYSHQPT